LKTHFSSYTHDPAKIARLSKPTAAAVRPDTKKVVEEQLRPRDLAGEMEHIDKTGGAYTNAEQQAAFAANAPPGAVISGDGDQNGASNGNGYANGDKPARVTKDLFAETQDWIEENHRGHIHNTGEDCDVKDGIFFGKSNGANGNGKKLNGTNGTNGTH
jgi:hypothetical protein